MLSILLSLATKDVYRIIWPAVVIMIHGRNERDVSSG